MGGTLVEKRLGLGFQEAQEESGVYHGISNLNSERVYQ